MICLADPLEQFQAFVEASTGTGLRRPQSEDKSLRIDSHTQVQDVLLQVVPMSPVDGHLDVFHLHTGQK